jgi:hypothetical protein
MSTPQPIARVAPRFRIRLSTLITALGALVAITVSIAILALTGAHHTTAKTPPTPVQATGGSVPATHYLGPRQQREGLTAQTAPTEGGATPTGAGNPVPHYTCLGAAQQRCLP